MVQAASQQTLAEARVLFPLFSSSQLSPRKLSRYIPLPLANFSTTFRSRFSLAFPRRRISAEQVVANWSSFSSYLALRYNKRRSYLQWLRPGFRGSERNYCLCFPRHRLPSHLQIIRLLPVNIFGTAELGFPGLYYLHFSVLLWEKCFLPAKLRLPPRPATCLLSHCDCVPSTRKNALTNAWDKVYWTSVELLSFEENRVWLILELEKLCLAFEALTIKAGRCLSTSSNIFNDSVRVIPSMHW